MTDRDPIASDMIVDGVHVRLRHQLARVDELIDTLAADAAAATSDARERSERIARLRNQYRIDTKRKPTT